MCLIASASLLPEGETQDNASQIGHEQNSPKAL